ncbi:MAG: alpha/beta hydrolase [Leptospirales bacterium]|nr:alpha/beta hydrolase [Leptospirales bacterium]
MKKWPRLFLAGIGIVANLACGAAGLRRQPDQAYLGDNNDRHQADLFYPTGAPKAAALFIHGGFWRNQDRRYFRLFTGLYSNVGESLAARGVATAVISYRLFPEASPEEQLRDVAAAVAWFQKEIAQKYGPLPLTLVGHSAGGHLALLSSQKPGLFESAGADRSRIHGIVALSPVLDIAGMAAGSEEEFNRELTRPHFGEDPSQWASFSPQQMPVDRLPEVLLISGEQDLPYIVSQCRQFAAILRARGKLNAFMEIPGYSHSQMVLSISSAGDPVSDAMASFILRESASR